MAKPSRKKYQEALRCLKQTCRNDKLSFPLRVRAAELICLIYGLPPLESTARVKRGVKELVQEGRFDTEVKEQVEQKVRADAEQAARAFLGRVKNAPAGENN
jgi:hypothetical protein